MTTAAPICTETPAERMANIVTHAFGAALSVAAIVVLVTIAAAQGGPTRIVTAAIFSSTLLLTYTSSTLFHYVRTERFRYWFKVCDHASIYALIAGTYTPILLVLMRGGWGWSLFGVLWGLTIVGTALKVFFVDRYEPLSVAVYVAMGWICLVAIKPFMAALPPGAFAWLAVGGVVYTLGVIFFLWEKLRFNHAIWHLFTLAGSACHFFAIMLYVLPKSA